VLSLVDTSDDGQWALVIKEPAHSGSGRVSSDYAIIHLPTGRELTDSILGSERGGILPFAFVMEAEGVYVEYEKIAGGETGRRPCRLYPR